MPGTCTVCGKDSDLCCSDCRIEQRTDIYICPRETCMDTHESGVHGPQFDVHTWSMSTGPKDLICPCCGFTTKSPDKVGDACPKCRDENVDTLLESIDPDIVSALEPFANETPKDDFGSVWAYEKQTIKIPSTETFSILLQFGEAKKLVPETDMLVRVSLLGRAGSGTEAE